MPQGIMSPPSSYGQCLPASGQLGQKTLQDPALANSPRSIQDYIAGSEMGVLYRSHLLLYVVSVYAISVLTSNGA